MTDQSALPRLCFVGPMIGPDPGVKAAPGVSLARGLSASGYPVKLVSRRLNRYTRPVDIAWTLWAQRGWIDVQMVQVYSGPGFILADLASLIGKALGQKLVFCLRGGNLPDFSHRHPAWVRRVFRRADRLVAPSAYLKRQLAWLGLPVQVIPNHIEIDCYPYRRRADIGPRLFWMRTFHPIYNPAMAVRVLERLKPDLPDVRLVMAGPDEICLQQTKQLVSEHGLQAQISFPGCLDLQAKVRLAGEQDIYLNTNRVDNTPVTVIEMGALGLPVVATRVGGVPDMIQDGHNGLLVPDDDDRAMAEAVKRLLAEPGLAERLALAGRRFAESCSWEIVQAQWESLLAGLSMR